MNQLIEAGQLTEEEAEAFEHSNIILQALGTTEQVSVDLTFHELCDGDRVMLCSDGLSGLVHFEMIREVLADTPDIRQCCIRLVEMANAGGGHDNITCIVADFHGPGLLPADRPGAMAFQRYPKQLGSGEEDRSPLPPREVTMKATIPKPGADVKRDAGAAADDAEPAANGGFSWGLVAVLGMVLIVFGAIAFFLSGSRSEESLEASPAQPPEAALAEVAHVEVRVRTDVPDAHLFVDGEDIGPIALDEEVLLEVVPGAYRFEARVGEDVEATVVRSIQADAPQEVELRLPAGAADADEREQAGTPPAPAP
ncbi:MAG: hypothetical protein H5U40_05265 [Polyangiaceae bacterium]|nr:hypothetical protein [Polyangiaceae bacterium]